jgi:hypothetical protein
MNEATQRELCQFLGQLCNWLDATEREHESLPLHQKLLQTTEEELAPLQRMYLATADKKFSRFAEFFVAWMSSKSPALASGCGWLPVIEDDFIYMNCRGAWYLWNHDDKPKLDPKSMYTIRLILSTLRHEAVTKMILLEMSYWAIDWRVANQLIECGFVDDVIEFACRSMQARTPDVGHSAASALLFNVFGHIYGGGGDSKPIPLGEKFCLTTPADAQLSSLRSHCETKSHIEKWLGALLPLMVQLPQQFKSDREMDQNAIIYEMAASSVVQWSWRHVYQLLIPCTSLKLKKWMMETYLPSITEAMTVMIDWVQRPMHQSASMLLDMMASVCYVRQTFHQFQSKQTTMTVHFVKFFNVLMFNSVHSLLLSFHLLISCFAVFGAFRRI